jgi:hypothetical protein
MHRHIVISPHTAEECAAVVKQVYASGFLTHVEWGCKSGEHTGWVFVEADSPQHALMLVPSMMRPQAKAIPVDTFGPKEMKMIG